MKVYIYLRLLAVAGFLYAVTWIPFGNAAGHGQCKSKVSNFGKALKHHTYDKFKVNRPDACIKRCKNEPECRSLNYVMEERICELNNRNKESNPGDYVSDPKRFYMPVPFKRGPLFHWTLSGTDSQLNLHGAAQFVDKNGKKVLYLDGTSGTYAETSAVPFQKTDLTIAVWIKLVSPSGRQQIYGDWSEPWQFRFDVMVDGRLCFHARRNVETISDMLKFCTESSVDRDVWRHVAVTWGRATRKVRLYINGDVKQEQVIPDDPVLDLKMSGHSVYDIGLKRDSMSTTHAYFSDLVVFMRELSETELKNEWFLPHPLHSFI